MAGTNKERLIDALTTAFINFVETISSKKLIGLVVTIYALDKVSNSTHANILIPAITAMGGLQQISQGASDTWGRGKVKAQNGGPKIKEEKVTIINQVPASLNKTVEVVEVNGG